MVWGIVIEMKGRKAFSRMSGCLTLEKVGIKAENILLNVEIKALRLQSSLSA